MVKHTSTAALAQHANNLNPLLTGLILLITN